MSERSFTVEKGDDARQTQVRLLVVQGDERPAVEAVDEDLVMTFPHLIVREAIAFLALSLGLVVLSLVADAPLEELADPTRTPNPAKAPWYFLGLQELLHYYPPVVSGVLLPGLLIVALVIIPYFRINLVRPAVEHDRRIVAAVWSAIGALTFIFLFTGSQPVWPLIGPLWLTGAAMTLGAVGKAERGIEVWLRARSLPFWIFVWFLLAAVTLTVIGVFFRGPGWRFTLPWRDGVFY